MSKAEHRLPSRTRSMVVAALAFALCALGFGVASATAEAPEVTAPVVSEVSYATAHVEGEVDPKGGSAEWFFELSTNGTDWERSNVGGGVEGSGLQAVEGDLEGLKPGTKYEIRLSATNNNGPMVSSTAPNPEFTTKSLPALTVSIDPVTTFASTTATFSGEIDPEAPAGNPPAANVDWHFECSPACPNLDISSSPTANPIPADSSAHAVEAEAAGLEPNTTYEVFLVGKNAGDPVKAGPAEFTTDEVAPDAQTIPAFVLKGGSSALLGARINPHNSETTYWFEIEGPDGTVAVPATEDASAGNGGTAQVVTQKVLDLAPGTTYDFHVVAKSAGGQGEGNSVSFTTPTPAAAEGECANKQFRVGPSASLPECRAFELVSPPEIGGAGVVGPHINPGTGAESVVSYPAVAGDGNAAVWSTLGFLPGVDSDGLYDTYLSKRTAEGWISEYALPPASKRWFFTGFAFADPNLNRLAILTQDEHLDPTDPDPGCACLTSIDIFRREPDGQFVRLSQGPDEQAGESNQPHAAFSSDLNTVVFTSAKPLVSGGGNVYARVGDTTKALPVAGIPADISSDGGTVVLNEPGVEDSLGGQVINIVTDNLSRVVTVVDTPIFSAVAAYGERLSKDGSTLFYWSAFQETPDDTDESIDLYEFDLATESKRRVSAPTGNPSQPGSGNRDSCPDSWLSGVAGEPKCNARWIATADDGSFSYFVSPELLDGDLGVSGSPNLYLHIDDETKYVTTLSPNDGVFELFAAGGGDWASSELRRDVQVTPDQSKLIFQSRARVTAYDNAGHSEIYTHDIATGEIACVSCRPDGSPAEGDALMRAHAGKAYEPAPEAPVSIAASNSSGTKVFFATSDRLRAADTDSNSDVYAVDTTHGQVSLIGNQAGDRSNYFWGVGADGRDLFLLSQSSLSPDERSVGAAKLYDARIGGGFAAKASDPGQVCEGEACYGQGPEPLPGISSITSRLEGPGNPVPHRKWHKHKHHKKKHRADKKHTKRSHGKHRGGNNGGNH